MVTYSAVWGSTYASCTQCHSMTDPGTGSHGAHMAASGSYGISMACGSCHPDNTGLFDHMDAAVTFSIASTGYTGNAAAPYGTPFGSCTTSTCHNDGTGSAVATSTWGTSIAGPNCGICHQFPNDTGRHTVHVANTDYVSGSCAECHTDEAAVTHIDTLVDIAGSSNVAYWATGGCTNDCHVVTAASTGDWLDTADLSCRDCHSGTYIGGGSFLPVSGLHDITPTMSGATHAEALSPAAGCGVCHTGMVPMVSDPASHVDGTWEADGAANTETRALFGDYTDGTPGTCSGASAGAAGCHDGPGDLGSWARLWDTSAAASTGAECANCHGDFTTWVVGGSPTLWGHMGDIFLPWTI